MPMFYLTVRFPCEYAQATFEAQFIKKLNNTEAELRKKNRCL